MAGRARLLPAYQERSGPDNVIILHFSIGSQVSSFAYHLPDKLMLVYHNITPPHWFAHYLPRVAKQCFKGRQELTRLTDRTSLAVGVSEYNRRELESMGFDPTGVLPYRSDPELFSVSPSSSVFEMFDDAKVNFLFVGRVMPNKRFEDLLKVFKIYQKHIDRNCRLILVGECCDFERYYEDLLGLADKLALENVFFPGHVSTSDLVAYYSVADLFLCMSEHEGFCAPILEAFRFGIPVMAFAAGAVPETMGGAGVLIHEKKFEEIAELAFLLLNDATLHERVVAEQDRVLEEIASRDTEGLLLDFVKRVGG
jgi:glycosyltransferase involved in cell wall biosynthesis